jgi:hypothetical protein
MSKYYEELPLKVIKKNIFEAESPEKSKSTEPPKPPKTDRKRFSKLASSVRGLAESNPDALLNSLKASDFKPSASSSKQDKIMAFLRHVFSRENEPGELYWNYLFDQPVKSGNNVVIPIAQLDTEDDEKISPPKTVCTSFISSLLYAAATSSDKKIDWSEEDDLAITSYAGRGGNKQGSVVLKISG